MNNNLENNNDNNNKNNINNNSFRNWLKIEDEVKTPHGVARIVVEGGVSLVLCVCLQFLAQTTYL